jgi:hypothetical protein
MLTSLTLLTCGFATVIVAAGGERRGKFAATVALSRRIGNPSLRGGESGFPAITEYRVDDDY